MRLRPPRNPSRQRGFIGIDRTLYSSGNPLATSPVGQIISQANFYAAFSDLGSGLVDTSLYKGQGAATFTRATVAWTKLSTGLWAQIASGSARSTYLGSDTTVGTYGGYFAEGAGIQLVTPTASIRDMTDASWVAVTMTTAKTSTGIDGVGSSCTRCTASAGNATILQTLVAAATTRTYSCFIKRITGTGEIDISEDGTSWTNITGQINSSTFTRVSITVSQLNAAFGLRIVTSGDAIDVDFNQFEAGSFATSPMDAAGATRNADVLTYPFANALATIGSCYSEVYSFSPSMATSRFAVSFASNTGPIFITTSGANTVCDIADGTNTIEATGLSDVSAAIVKRASSWGNNLYITGDGVAPVTGAFTGTMGSTNIGIGCGTDGSRSWYGTVKNIRIWKQQFVNAQLQALTS